MADAPDCSYTAFLLDDRRQQFVKMNGALHNGPGFAREDHRDRARRRGPMIGILLDNGPLRDIGAQFFRPRSEYAPRLQRKSAGSNPSAPKERRRLESFDPRGKRRPSPAGQLRGKGDEGARNHPSTSSTINWGRSRASGINQPAAPSISATPSLTGLPAASSNAGIENRERFVRPSPRQVTVTRSLSPI